MQHISWFTVFVTAVWGLSFLFSIKRYLTRRMGGRVAVGPVARALDPGEEIVMRGMIGQGQRIEAMRYYREKTGAGLKEAKAYVERLARG
ncbi:MAG TPA: hypothetical protein V6D47_00030 [Oscillatoriaceae cyanobacterium]